MIIIHKPAESFCRAERLARGNKSPAKSECVRLNDSRLSNIFSRSEGEEGQGDEAGEGKKEKDEKKERQGKFCEATKSAATPESTIDRENV